MAIVNPVTRLAMLRPVSIFRALHKATLMEAARKSIEVTHPAGATVVQQGDPGDAMYVVVEGTAEVQRNGQVVAHLKEGDYFGEISLIDGEPRSATVVATSDLVLLALKSSDFESLLKVPYVMNGVMVNLARMLREAHDSRYPNEA